MQTFSYFHLLPVFQCTLFARFAVFFVYFPVYTLKQIK